VYFYLLSAGRMPLSRTSVMLSEGFHLLSHLCHLFTAHAEAARMPRLMRTRGLHSTARHF
jgi:hypothetical protein